MVNTWPQVGNKIGPNNTRKQTGYQVSRSVLKSFTPNSTGILNIYPSLTPEFRINKDRAQLRLKRSWLKGELWLDWYYKQKRAEVINFTLDHTFQLKGRIRSRQKRLKIQLQQIDGFLDKPSCSSFFHTPRGRETIQHAIEMAKSHLAETARCVQVEFKVPLENGIDIGLNDSIILKNDLIPNGHLEGKVTEYRLNIHDQERTVWLRLGVAIGGLDSSELEGIIAKSYEDQQPKQGLINPELLNLEDFVKRIEVRGHAEEQIRHLLDSQTEGVVNLEDGLGAKPTTIDIELLDLRTHDVLEHVIDCNLTGGWSGPNQIAI